jgi:hypothetical protein
MTTPSRPPHIRIEAKGKNLLGIIRIAGKDYTAEYPVYKDKRYSKNKLCLQLLLQASVDSDLAWRLYKQLAKGYFFMKGLKVEQEEDYETEFKGGKDSLKCMQQNEIRSLCSEIGRTVCGFLNTAGGSLLVGIHNQTNVVQGIKIADKDKFKLSIQQSILTRLTQNRITL